MDLRFGKVPSPLTQEVMSFGRASSLNASERKKMDQWVAEQKATNDSSQQLILMAFGSGRRFGRAPPAPRGRPKEYRLDFGRTFLGKTLSEIARTSTPRQFGPQYITDFLGSAKFERRQRRREEGSSTPRQAVRGTEKEGRGAETRKKKKIGSRESGVPGRKQLGLTRHANIDYRP